MLCLDPISCLILWLTGLYDEIKAMKQACGKAHMKTILAVGELGSAANVYKCSLVAMMAGKHGDGWPSRFQSRTGNPSS